MKIARVVIVRVATLLLLFSLFPIAAAWAAPAITRISPTVGPVSPVGAPLTITGTGFGSTQDTSTITVGGIISVPTSWSDTRIVAPVPGGLLPGSVDVSVTVGGVASGSKSFFVIPVITSVSPATVSIGGAVTVTGTSFGATQGASTITFNGLTAVPTAWSNTSVTIPVPAGALSGPIVVTVNGLATNGINYWIAPRIDSISPVSGPDSGIVMIVGSGFGRVQNFNPVTVGGVSVTPLSWIDTSITVPVPGGLPAGNANVVVTVNTTPSNAMPYLVAPFIGGLSANLGLTGASITVTGSSFGANQGASTIAFNGVAAIPSSWSDTSISVQVPSNATSGPVIATINGVASNSVNFTVVSQSAIYALNPASGPMGTLVTITGSNFGAAQGNGQVQIGGQLMTVTSWTDNAVTAVVPMGAAIGRVVLTTGAGQALIGPSFIVTSTGPILQLSISDSPLQVSLTSPQNLDWVHWGRIALVLPDRKDTPIPLISDYSLLNGTTPTAASGATSFSWSDGNHPAAVFESNSDIEAFNTGGGFQITVPADTTPRTLNLYAEVFGGQALMQASLSDGSAATINDESVTDLDFGSKKYSIDYQAAGAGQTLTVRISLASLTGGIGLQAATLTPHLPVVVVDSPVAGQSISAPASVLFSVNAAQLDASAVALRLTGSDGSVFQSPTAPFAASWGPLPGGHYIASATATDTAGLTNTSIPVEFDVIAEGGSISFQKGDVSLPVDLTEGTADWVLWGPFSNGDLVFFNPGLVEARKAGVAPLISNYQLIGNHVVTAFTLSNNLVFTDGAQVFSSGSEILVHGRGNGYEITFPAGTTSRALRLYVGAISARGKLTAFLSDGSAPVVTDTSFDFPNPPDFSGFGGTAIYTLNYRAASPSQVLTVRYTLDHDYGNGEIDLFGAILGGDPSLPSIPTPQITSLDPAVAPVDTRITVTGTNFGANQGASAVFFGELPVQVVSWSDTGIVTIVPAGLGDGNIVMVSVITGAGASNEMSFAIPAFKIYPPSLSLVVNQSATVRTKDSSGRPVTGLAWVSSDPSVVAITADDPPTVIGRRPGSATVYAGDVPLPVTVYAGTALPPGTVLWSAPVGPGATSVAGLVPAVPSDSGIDIYVQDDRDNVSALTSDGELVWRQFVWGLEKVIPDFAGNTLVRRLNNFVSPVDRTLHSTHTISKVDPGNGNLIDFYTYAEKRTGSCCFDDQGSFEMAIPGTSGVLFTQDNATVTAIDMMTGAQLANATLDRSTFITVQDTTVITSMTQDPSYSRMIVAGDGAAYVAYDYSEITETGGNGVRTFQTVNHPRLLRVAPDGAVSRISLGDAMWTITDVSLASLPVADATHTSDAFHRTRSGSPTTVSSVITNGGDGVTAAGRAGWGQCTDEVFGDYFIDGNPQRQTYQSFCPNIPFTTQISVVTQGALASQTTADIENFVPVLQREDGSYIGTTAFTYDIAAVDPTGVVRWHRPGLAGFGVQITPVFATADGGGIVSSTVEGSGEPGTLYIIDQAGNVTGQSPDLRSAHSWLGHSYAASPNGLSQMEGSLALAPASFAVETGGNPTGNGTAIAQCPCLFQTDDPGILPNSIAGPIASPVASQEHLTSQAPSDSLSPVAPAGPLVCPLCDLLPPNCVTFDGPQSTFVLIVGDPGLNGHNLGNILNLAAQTKANELQAQGHRVVACRASSVDDFNNMLLQNGFIDGGVFFFGHGGPHEFFSVLTGEALGAASILALGQAAGARTNITASNVNLLADVQNAYSGVVPAPGHPDRNILGPSASIWLNGCSAGEKIPDFLAGYDTSIAQQIANQVKRTVYAYEVGVYFSQSQPANDQHFDGTGLVNGRLVSRKLPNSLPMYAVPVGAHGHKPDYTPFIPQ